MLGDKMTNRPSARHSQDIRNKSHLLLLPFLKHRRIFLPVDIIFYFASRTVLLARVPGSHRQRPGWTQRAGRTNPTQRCRQTIS